MAGEERARRAGSSLGAPASKILRLDGAGEARNASELEERLLRQACAKFDEGARLEAVEHSWLLQILREIVSLKEPNAAGWMEGFIEAMLAARDVFPAGAERLCLPCCFAPLTQKQRSLMFSSMTKCCTVMMAI